MTAVGSGLPAAADSASPAEEGGVQYSMADPAPQTETGETAPFNDRMVRAAPSPQAIQEEPADPSAESTPEERGTVATASDGGRIAVQTPRAIRLTAAQAGELLEELPYTAAEDGVRCYQLTWEEFDRLLDCLAERDIVPEEQEDAPEAEGLSEGYDLVYGYYPEKKHSWFRNLGSHFNDLTVNLMIKKPKDVHTSSYFVVRKFIRDHAIEYTGSYTYLLGLFMRCTQNIASVPVQHFEREVGESGYTLKQLIRLWSSIIGFSVIPLRVASITGFFFAGIGLLAALAVLIRKFIDPHVSMGWPSIMCAIFFFFGLNFMFLGMIGEYLGRMFLGMNKEPQYVIKAVYNAEEKKEEER